MLLPEDTDPSLLQHLRLEIAVEVDPLKDPWTDEEEDADKLFPLIRRTEEGSHYRYVTEEGHLFLILDSSLRDETAQDHSLSRLEVDAGVGPANPERGRIDGFPVRREEADLTADLL